MNNFHFVTFLILFLIINLVVVIFNHFLNFFVFQQIRTIIFFLSGQNFFTKTMSHMLLQEKTFN